MLALGVPFDRPAPRHADAAALVSRLEQLASVLDGGSQLTHGTSRSLSLPGYPRTQAATELLTSALRPGVAGSDTPPTN